MKDFMIFSICLTVTMMAISISGTAIEPVVGYQIIDGHVTTPVADLGVATEHEEKPRYQQKPSLDHGIAPYSSLLNHHGQIPRKDVMKGETLGHNTDEQDLLIARIVHQLCIIKEMRTTCPITETLSEVINMSQLMGEDDLLVVNEAYSRLQQVSA